MFFFYRRFSFLLIFSLVLDQNRENSHYKVIKIFLVSILTVGPVRVTESTRRSRLILWRRERGRGTLVSLWVRGLSVFSGKLSTTGARSTPLNSGTQSQNETVSLGWRRGGPRGTSRAPIKSLLSSLKTWCRGEGSFVRVQASRSGLLSDGKE